MLPIRVSQSSPDIGAARSSAVLSLVLTNDGAYCLAGGQDRTARLFNPHKSGGLARPIHEYAGEHGYEIRAVVVAHDNTRFASGGGDRAVFWWDAANGRVVRRFRGHEQRVNALALNQESSVLFVGSYDRFVAAWDLRAQSKEPIQMFREAKDSVTSLVVTGSQVLAGYVQLGWIWETILKEFAHSSVDGCVRTYDVRIGRLVTDHIGGKIEQDLAVKLLIVIFSPCYVRFSFARSKLSSFKWNGRFS